jgi:hypothetical protein
MLSNAGGLLRILGWQPIDYLFSSEIGNRSETTLEKFFVVILFDNSSRIKGNSK